MNTTDYANQEALNKALNIYRTCMRGFIIFHLAQIPGTTAEDVVIESVSDWRADAINSALNEGKDIKSIIDIDDFPLLVVGERGVNWRETFRDLLNDDKDFQNQLWLIKTCRDQSWAHPPEGGAESEGTRVYLFLIADVLRKIKRPDKQHEVEAIRDELDDTAERLAEAEERLKSIGAENTEYKKSLSETEKRLAAAESEKKEYEQKNEALSEQVDTKEKQRKKLDKQLKNAKTENGKIKKNLSGMKQRLEKSEAAQAEYKQRLETKSNELEDAKNELTSVQSEKSAFEEQLVFTQNLLITARIGDQSIFPAPDTDASVRILDRRGTDKRNYLLKLLEQRRPTLIYVQSEKMADLLLTDVLPEKESVIEKHGTQTSDAEEKELLGKLTSGESIAVVSNTVFSRLTPSHCVEHFVFCHLSPDLDTFFGRCQPAFTSTRNAYLHLIYENKQNIERYPKDKTIRELYKELKKLAETNGDFISHENVYDELNMEKLEIETGLVILEELQYLEQKKMGVKLLQSSGKQLKESITYCRGEKLRKAAENSPSFQLEHSIEQIWTAVVKK